MKHFYSTLIGPDYTVYDLNNDFYRLLSQDFVKNIDESIYDYFSNLIDNLVKLEPSKFKDFRNTVSHFNPIDYPHYLEEYQILEASLESIKNAYKYNNESNTSFDSKFPTIEKLLQRVKKLINSIAKKSYVLSGLIESSLGISAKSLINEIQDILNNKEYFPDIDITNSLYDNFRDNERTLKKLKIKSQLQSLLIYLKPIEDVIGAPSYHKLKFKDSIVVDVSVLFVLKDLKETLDNINSISKISNFNQLSWLSRIVNTELSNYDIDSYSNNINPLSNDTIDSKDDIRNVDEGYPLG